MFAGLPRSAFDNKSVSFEEHIKIEHNMWHYLNFIVLVKVKKSTEFTGPESYVSEMVRVSVLTNQIGMLLFLGFFSFLPPLRCRLEAWLLIQFRYLCLKNLKDLWRPDVHFLGMTKLMNVSITFVFSTISIKRLSLYTVFNSIILQTFADFELCSVSLNRGGIFWPWSVNFVSKLQD